MTRRRPDRETARRLLAAHGKQVTLNEPKLVEDVHGYPAGVETVQHEGMLYVTAEMLGWTRAELGLDEEHP